MIPIRIKMTIEGDRVIYDFTGSHPCIGSIYNSAFGATFSGVVAGMKTFFPDLPLNSGFYRVLEIIAPEDTVVSAKWPVAVTGFLMPFEKIMNATYEMWSKIMPQRAISCTFNIEYLLTGGTDTRDEKKPIFMFYDWLPGGWGGRNGRDGTNLMNACFGTGMLSQPVEGQERGNPILTTEFEAIDRFRRPRQMARRRRRAEDQPSSRSRKYGDFLHLRPRARRGLGHQWRTARPCRMGCTFDAPGPIRTLGSARCFPTCRSRSGDLFSRPTRRRRRLRRSARTRPRQGARRTSRTTMSPSSGRRGITGSC